MQNKTVFELLLETSNAITSELELEKVVQRVTDIGTELSGAQFGAFFYNVINDLGESYTLYTISGVAKEAFSKFPMPRNTKIFEPTFLASGTVRYEDVTKEPHYGQNPPYHGMPKGHLPVKSYLAVPVVSPFTKEPIGGLFFGHPDPGVFTKESEQLIEGVATQAAIAIANARLFEDKKATEQKLLQQREQYRSIFNATSDSVIIYDVDGTIAEANPSACEIFGYKYHELVGSHASALFKEPKDFEVLKEIALSGRQYAGRNTRRKKDGSYFEAEFKGSHFFYKDKPHVLSIVREVSSEKKIEEALKKTEGLSSIVTSVSPVTLWMTNSAAETVYINQTWSDWVGGSIKEHLGAGWLNAIVPEDKERVIKEFMYAFENRKVYTSDFRIRRRNGDVRWCSTQGSPYYNLDGAFGGFAGSLTDITDRKLVEEQLASQNVLINTITNNTLQALFLIDEHQYCTYMNPAAEKMTGFKLHELQEKQLHYYIQHTYPDGRHFPIEESRIDSALRSGRQTGGEEVFIHKDGQFYPVQFTASPIIENGSPKGTVIEARDVSEEKRIEAELRTKEQETMKMLEQKVKERTMELEKSNYELLQFTSVASHDLKEPIRKIAVFSGRLRDELGGQATLAAERYLHNISDASKRMAALIDDLLSYSRLSHNTDEFEDVNLKQLVQRILNDLEISIQEKNATINIGDLPVIPGINIQLGQVFQNLISNSLKFAHPERRLTINISAEAIAERYYKIRYEDNGIGFSPNESEKIFDVFYRLHSKQEYEGTGVGLSIVKKIIDHHKGKIEAQGRENEGAVFEIIFPKQQVAS